jgi:hypothetical protein
MGEAGTVRSLAEYFAERSSRFHRILCIAGNHDVSFHDEFYNSDGRWKRFRHPHPLDPSECRSSLQQHSVYLEDEEHEALQLRFYGSRWTIEFYDWAFALPEDRMERVWERIPLGIDVLVTHGPPFGRCDATRTAARAGCRHLLNRVQSRVRPRLHVFGHIHEGDAERAGTGAPSS